VDFLTLHCGVNQQALAALRSDPRLMGVVSRGGSFHCAMMMQRDEENPLYAEYDYLLEILVEHDVTISLGDGMRPGCLQDAGLKSVEYTLSMANSAGKVQRMIEVDICRLTECLISDDQRITTMHLYGLGPIIPMSLGLRPYVAAG
jgi:phosphomethylpyrimidine synthase